MKKTSIFLFFLSCVVFLPMFLYSPPQTKEGIVEKPTPAELRLKGFDQHLKLKGESIFKNLKWKSIGPQAMSGRITDIDVPKGIPFTIYASAASGGVWKTKNNGTTWEPIWDDTASNSVGDIAIADSDPNIVWVGAGENNSSRSSYSGTGVYKSTDAGKTWRCMGLSDTHHISRIVIDPHNPDIVYVAAIGHLYTRNEERGVFKTTDGGDTWKKVLYINENTGVIDLVMDPSDNGTLYAAAWERIRKAWDMVKHGKGSGIYKSADRGETWKRLTNGFPAGELIGRIGLDVSISKPNIVYALVDNQNARTDEKAKDLEGKLKRIIPIGAEVYRSDDKGDSWRKVNNDDLANLYYLEIDIGYYFGQIRVSPDNEDEIYLLGAPLFRSKDGGKTYERISYRGLHADHHALWINPKNPDQLINGNDGGLNFSYDRGKTWIHIKMPIGQFYSVAVDMEDPFNIYGSLQDNGCWYGPVTSIQGEDETWKSFPGGESSYVAIDPLDSNTIYTSAGLRRTDRKTLESKDIEPKAKEGEPPIRRNWHPPFILSSHNPRIIYYGTQKLQMSLDRGDHWQAMSPDLTTDNPQKQVSLWDVQHCTITTISESPLKFGLIYIGTDDGNVWVTKNLGVTWEKVMKGLPANKWVSRIIASRFEEGSVYVTLNGYRDDDFAAYVYKSTDYGKTWANIENNLPCGPINVIKEDPKKKNILYIGTDLGVYVSLDQGKSWNSLCSNLPTTFVHDLIVHPRDNILVIGTHGRSVYVTDANIIQEFDENIQQKDLYVFQIRPVYRVRVDRAREEVQARIYYYLKEEKTIKLEISDNAGKLMKTLEFKGRKGIDVAVWDLMLDGQGRRGRTASPGKYPVTIIAENDKVSGMLEIKPER